MPDTGAPYFIPFLDGTELVRAYPELSEDLADAIVNALENIPVTQKKIEAFTGDGTWTVPAGVTYAIAHMRGGGGGVGRGSSGDGSVSSVAFASGTVEATGGLGMDLESMYTSRAVARAGNVNAGNGAVYTARNITDSGGGTGQAAAGDGAVVVAGAAVTPAASITVTVGAGGLAGTGGAAGGSGYVYIEYFEEV